MPVLFFSKNVPISKRLMDLVFTIPGLVILSPLIGLISILVLVVDGAPIFFKQERPGIDARIFKLIKFRTMRKTLDLNGNLLPDGQRLTRLGGFLRATSLDELPELWNVLRGDMSLVGPRPLLVEYLPRYSAEQARRHTVLPGITGWAQVNGRNALSWEEKFRLDVWYVDHQSLGLDIKILVRTISMVLRREGIHAPGQATMAEFRGSMNQDNKP